MKKSDYKPSVAYRIYRLSRIAHLKHIPLIPGLLMRINRVIFACEIPYIADIAEKCNLYHNGLGVVIHGYAIIGKGTKIYQNVTIGGRGKRGSPIIGQNVSIGCGACVLGGVYVGDGAKIGANAVVITDVPPEATAVGVPAKIIEHKKEINYE